MRYPWPLHKNVDIMSKNLSGSDTLSSTFEIILTRFKFSSSTIIKNKHKVHINFLV